MTSSAGQRISCNVVETRRNDVARIFNIQRYSLNDGEGIRTVVFFKGCPHLCPWCAKEGANKRGNSSRLTQSFHFFMFEPIFSPVNAL
ncbi:4Fe-4S cluster-binding domain-containing protein, partial [Escherichia coli]